MLKRYLTNPEKPDLYYQTPKNGPILSPRCTSGSIAFRGNCWSPIRFVGLRQATGMEFRCYSTVLHLNPIRSSESQGLEIATTICLNPTDGSQYPLPTSEGQDTEILRAPAGRSRLLRPPLEPTCIQILLDNRSLGNIAYTCVQARR